MGVTKELRKFVAPEIITGVDARLITGRYLAHFAAQNPMIVTDKAITEFEWFQDTVAEIAKYVKHYFIFDGVTSNPRDTEVMRGAELFLEKGCDLIIAIGGGSPIDCAKGISIVSTNGGHILDYEGVDEINLPGPPLICIPSTSGASADVSQFAIICDTTSHVKKAIISKKVVPDLALIDPIPLMTMDYYLTACTGMDALTHAIEAYVSNANSALTDLHALEAIRIISQTIEEAVKPTRTVDTMYQMMLGSMEAGLAFSNASLGAVHAMAHSLGGLLDLPHGECNSILLEHIVNLNFMSEQEKYTRIAECMQVKTDGLTALQIRDALTERIRNLRNSLGIKGYAEVPDMGNDILEKLSEGALADPCIVTNPRILAREEVRKVYGRILQPKRAENI